MRRHIKDWTFRLTFTAFFIAGILLVIILNPVLTYANKTTHHNFTIYHNGKLDQALPSHLDHANELLKNSEFYNEKLKLSICLNDGSAYTQVIQTLRGKAFAWGFYDKVVLQGTANYKSNYIELNHYKWNATQLLAHEMVHCLQFDKLGLWKSNPVANIATWKWEGYAEYISRQGADQKDIIANLDRLYNADKDSWEIVFADGTISPREYYNYWTLVQYCMDIKKMTYAEVLTDTMAEEDLTKEMMEWYVKKKKDAAKKKGNGQGS